jgi:hypothetical protein
MLQFKKIINKKILIEIVNYKIYLTKIDEIKKVIIKFKLKK